MMFITKKHLSRRTFLRGAGVAVALPFLESMVPAQTPLARTAAAGKTRFASIYVPHGATMYKWTPATEGRNFEMSESLSPLEKYRDRLNVISNLCHQSAKGAERACALGRNLSDGRLSAERRSARRHQRRSDCSLAYRSGHTAAFAGTRHRGGQSELRRRLRLRLLQHGFVAHSHGSIADGK